MSGALVGLNAVLEPGTIVRLVSQPDWGIGQVQSRIGTRITVNFQDAGKQVIDGSKVELSIAHKY